MLFIVEPMNRSACFEMAQVLETDHGMALLVQWIALELVLAIGNADGTRLAVSVWVILSMVLRLPSRRGQTDAAFGLWRCATSQRMASNPFLRTCGACEDPVQLQDEMHSFVACLR